MINLFQNLDRYITKYIIRWYKNYNRKSKKNKLYPYCEVISYCRNCIHRNSDFPKMGKIKKCPNKHTLKIIGHSCCDDICQCECGKWFVCGLGSIWRYVE